MCKRYGLMLFFHHEETQETAKLQVSIGALTC